MDAEVKEILPKLIAAVEATLDHSTSHQYRIEAYQSFRIAWNCWIEVRKTIALNHSCVQSSPIKTCIVYGCKQDCEGKACEDFKENSPFCIQCGLLMANKKENHIVRHFGLQLLEHCVRYRWNSLSAEEKMFIKENTMKLLAEGTLFILEEQAHIKDGLSRIVVEMAKREWPQQWPTLMKELNDICRIGPTQTELVLLFFLRLAEDVLLFQVVPSQRRREIMSGLTSDMQDIFAFFLNTLQSNYNTYQQMKCSVEEPSRQLALTSCKVAQAVLNAMSAFIDWISWSFVVEQNGLLLQLLCLMLSDEKLQLPAAECLLIITNRKGKVGDRKPLLIFFSPDAMSTILNAAVTAAQASLEEYSYLFLKKLCQVLISLGSQLCALWGTSTPDGTIGPPNNFSLYLEAILAFTQNASQVLGSYTHTLWPSFLRHELISQDSTFLAFLPKVLETTRHTLCKVGFPSQTSSPSCDFSRLDFDSDEDFNIFFSKYRAEIAETIRLATMICPTVTFSIASQWLSSLLQTPIDVGEGSDRSHCNLTSPSFVEWDALTVFLESVMLKLPFTDKPKPPVEECISLLKAVLNYDTRDPVILSCLLSCISALFVNVTHAPDVLPSVLNKIFSTAVFNLEGQTKATRSKAVRNVRRHACSVLVKICKQYPDALLPGFDQLYSHIKQLSSDPQQLSQMEKCTLMEALILISNQFKNFQKQNAFLAEILAPAKELWLSTELKEALWCTEKFMTYVGLNQPPVEPSSEDTCGINRSHIIYCMHFILGVLQRSSWPDELEVARSGGFILEGTESDNPVMRNAATPHIIGGMLENVLAFARTLNTLWLSEYLQHRHPDFEKAYDIPDVDKQVLLGIHPPCVDNTDARSCKQPVERMQSFLSSSHDTCCHILGHAGSSLGYEFYRIPHIANALLNSVMLHLETLPDYKLRPIIRVFLKPFIQHCPKTFHQTTVIPVLATLCPYMLQRLTAKWQVINQRSEEDAECKDDNPESQEIVDDQLTRQVTREYIEMLGAVFKTKRGSETTDECMDDSEMGGNIPSSQSHAKDDSVSELGSLVLQEENVFPSIVLNIFSGLNWSDNIICNKCIGLCWPVLKQLAAEKKLTSEDTCHLFSTILLGLQRHGQHEGSQNMLISLALQIYDYLRPDYPDVIQVMLQIPGCTESNLKTFNEKLAIVNPHKMVSEKKKKEMFKNLVQNIIGKNVGQQFKKDLNIMDLPPLYKRSRPKTMRLDEQEKKDLGLCALFMPEDHDH